MFIVVASGLFVGKPRFQPNLALIQGGQFKYIILILMYQKTFHHIQELKINLRVVHPERLGNRPKLLCNIMFMYVNV